MDDNEFKTKEKKNWTKDEIEPQHIYQQWQLLFRYLVPYFTGQINFLNFLMNRI